GSQAARKLYEWAGSKTDRFEWGQGPIQGSVSPVLDDHRGKQRLFTLYTHGSLHIPFGLMKKSIPFSEREKREELLRRLNRIDGVFLPDDGTDGWPSMKISALSTERSLSQFTEAMDWAVDQI